MTRRLIGLPAPPPVGATALPAGHLRRRGRVRHRRRHRARQGDRRRVRAARRVDRDRQPQARAPRGRPSRDRSDSARPSLDRRVRHPRRRADRGRVRRRRSRVRAARRARQQRGRELPGAGRGHVAQRVAHGRRHHAQRHVPLLPASSAAATSPRGTPGSIINVGASYAWTGGPGFVHSAAAKAGVKNLTESLAVEWGPYGIQVNGLVPGLFPHEDMTADIQRQPRPHRRQGRRASPRCGSGSARSSAGPRRSSRRPTRGSSPGHTLVVDGANWQRRTLTNPPVVTVRDQMGKEPFTRLMVSSKRRIIAAPRAARRPSRRRRRPPCRARRPPGW